MHPFKFFFIWFLLHPFVFSAVLTPIDPIPEVEEAQQAARLSKEALPNKEQLKGLHNGNPPKHKLYNVAEDLNDLRKDQQEVNGPGNLGHGGEHEFPEEPNKSTDHPNQLPDDETKLLPKDVEKKEFKKRWSFTRFWKSIRRVLKKIFRWFKKDITHHQYWVERAPIPIPESEIGPWRLNGWYKHNPRPGNDDGSAELQDLRVLGNELQMDYETRRARWIHHDLPKYHNPILNIALLSDKTFLELVIQYTKEYNQAKINQNQVKRIWNDLVYLFGNENHARDVLTKIEDYYIRVYPKVERDMFGIDFYTKMHNPLLLPTTQASEKANWPKIFEQEKIAIGLDEKTKKEKSKILFELCHEYRGYVDLWRKAIDSGSAIKKYLNTIKELTFDETRHPNQVFEKFKDLFPNRFNFARGLTDDIKEKLLASFPNMAFSG